MQPKSLDLDLHIFSSPAEYKDVLPDGNLLITTFKFSYHKQYLPKDYEFLNGWAKGAV